MIMQRSKRGTSELNGKKIVLSKAGSDKVPIVVNENNVISISATDKQNTKIIVENNRISEVRPKSNKKVLTT